MDAQSLLKRLEDLGVKGKSYAIARRLLDRASNQWTVFLSREEACELCEVTNWGSARRALIRLKDAGLIGLHTNNQAYVYFLEPPADGADAAESARTRAPSAREDDENLTEPRRNCAPARTNCANRAPAARQRAVSALPPKDQDQDQLQEGRKDPSYPDPDLEGGAGGNRPDAQKVRDSAQIDPSEKVRSVGLLTDPEVNLYPRLAIDAAERYTFQEIAAQVFRYVRDRAAKTARSPGCIPQRLAQPDKFPAVLEISDTETDLWQRHMTPEEAGRVIRSKYIPDEYADIILG